ncbi:hypothetical protein Poli38472_009189 [Pythium oligandrum]|uniref:Choline transporter-like protein n=1 Tax=Pythium oligandrum TaxID=41045 RepID=A0A8K1CME7_PYTOL|nr:hypothetical protein Poli38472_009189 [Pythium oligandrum]|eukprot:TMW65022.1 hypothetical protein Poli38472_009189 [Pythium oligandrum]
MGCCSKKPVEVAGTNYEQKTGVAPATTRKCRDVLCCLFFLVFWVGMIIVAIVGLMNGKPQRLLYGSDYNGTTCGTGDMKDKPLTFYPRINEDLIEQASKKDVSPTDFDFYGVCVATCPQQLTYFCNYEFEVDLASDSSLKTDADRNAAREKEAKKLMGEKHCWFVALASQKVFYRCIQMTETSSTSTEVCVYPGDESQYYDTVDGVKVPNSKCEVKKVRTISDATGPAQENPIYDKLQTAAAVVGRAIGDIEHTWEIILAFGGGAALVLGFVFIFMMKYCAGCFVWIALWAFVLMLLLFALMASTKAGIIKDSDISKLSSTLADAGIVAASQNGLQVPENLRASEDKKKVYAVVAYVFYALSGVAFLLVCFFQKKIRITVGIIKEASRAIQRLPLLVFFPLIPFVMILVLFIYSAIIGAFIYSSAELKVDKLGASASTMLSKVDSNLAMRILLGYHFFGFLWTNQLINAISMCTIAGAICRYYWSREKNAAEMGRFPVMYSFKNCFRYHFGSLAFGSFIIAVVQFIRAILMYIDHQTQDIQRSNLVVKVLMKIVQCCLWCFEKCLKFLSKNAYIMIAMKGRSFCSGAKDAFKTIFNNVGQIATVSMVSFLLLSAAKIAITMACAVIMFAYLEKNDDKYGIGGEKEISSPMAPIVLTILLAWFVASTFLGVYEMAIDTILLCFCEDKEINKATGQYYMSDKLKKFVASVPVSKIQHAEEQPAGNANDEAP